MTDLPTDRAWSIESDNDTGHGDEGFWEWWTVTNGVRSFKCDSEDDAKWLLSRLVQPVEAALQCRGVPDARCHYLAHCHHPCNKCGRVHNPLTLPHPPKD